MNNSIEITLAEKGTKGNAKPLAPSGTVAFTASGETFAGGEDGVEQTKEVRVSGTSEALVLGETDRFALVQTDYILSGGDVPAIRGRYVLAGEHSSRPFHILENEGDPDNPLQRAISIGPAGFWNVYGDVENVGVYKGFADTPDGITEWLPGSGNAPYPVVTAERTTKQASLELLVQSSFVGLPTVVEYELENTAFIVVDGVLKQIALATLLIRQTGPGIDADLTIDNSNVNDYNGRRMKVNADATITISMGDISGTGVFQCWFQPAEGVTATFSGPQCKTGYDPVTEAGNGVVEVYGSFGEGSCLSGDLRPTAP